MTTAYETQIEGCTGEFSSEINGYIFTRTLKLIGVVEDPTSGDVPDIDQAFSALVDNFVPGIGSDLSDVDFDLAGCWLRNIKVTPLGNNQWRVVLQYQHSPLNDVTGSVKVSSTTQVSSEDSNKGLPELPDHPNGKPITLIYEYPADYGGDEPTAREKLLRGTDSGEQGGTYSRLVPDTTRIYQIREPVDPLDNSSLIGTINNTDWFFTDDIGKWMLTDLTGTIDQSQQTPRLWVNSYTFQFKIDGWQPEVVFTDKNTNEPVPDPVEGQSKKTIDAYESNNFAALFPEFGRF